MALVDVAEVRWLGSPEGRAMLRALPPYEEAAAIPLITALRGQGLPAEHAAALVTQQRLRDRARAKFARFADGMLFTADGLEQATRLEVAATHAQRYAAASIATVHDLGCGIGSDAMATSALGVTVAAVDADPVTALIADLNLRPWPDSRARVGRAEEFRAPVGAGRDRIGAWLDPARRTPGVADINGRTRRVFRVEDISPSWDTVLAIAADVPATGVKLAPSFPHDRIPNGTEAQWTSYGGDVLECALWWGPLVRTSGRTARVLHPGRPPLTVTEDVAVSEPPVAAGLADVSTWLYECDRAVSLAGLVGALTAATDGRELEPGLGYVTSAEPYDLGFARRFRVVEAIPFSVKEMRAWMRRHEVTGLTIKKRGVRLDEDALRRQLKIGRGAGSGARAVVLLTRVAGQQVALVIEPA